MPAPGLTITDVASLRSRFALLLVAPVLAGCSFSFSAGGPDYDKLEGAIADELNGTYAEISREVSSVDCPRPSPTPKTGDTFVCGADVEGQNVRVEVKVNDDDYNVSFSTLDILFDLAETERGLSQDVSKEYGFEVTVTCGEGVKIVAIGASFDCEAVDQRGDARTVKLTAGDVGSGDSWEIVD